MRSCPPICARLSRTSSQCRLPSLLRRRHSKPTLPSRLRLLDPAHGFRFGVERLLRAQLAHPEAEEFVARVAIGLAGARIDVDDRARLPVVHEDRVLRGLEDLPVIRLGCAQRRGRRGALELGIDPHCEDAQRRLDERRVLKRPARDDGDQAERLAGGVGSADVPHSSRGRASEILVEREQLRQPRRDTDGTRGRRRSRTACPGSGN